MRLGIRHVTVYSYDAPLRFITQSHRLTPVSTGCQRVVDWRVSAEGVVFGEHFVDGAGDRVNTMTVKGPVERIETVVEGAVETVDTAGVLRSHAELISPRAYMS